MDDALATLRQAFCRAAVPSDAEPMAVYMKGQFDFVGLKSVARRHVQKSVLNRWKTAPADQVLTFAEHCWAEPEREFKYAACDLLRAHAKELQPVNLDRVERLIVDEPWWDTVDSLASHTVGPMVANHPELVATLDRWIGIPDSGQFWLSRTAILHQLGFKSGTDAERLFRYATTRAR